MLYYENLIIIDALLSDEEIAKQVDTFKSLLEKRGAKIIHEDVWGRRRLAYPIKKRRDGYYIFIYFTIDDKDAIKDFRKRYQITESVLRAIIFKLETKQAKEVLKDYFASQKDAEKEQKSESSKASEKSEKGSDQAASSEE